MRKLYTILFNLALVSSYSNATQITDVQLGDETQREILEKYKGKTVPYAVENGDTLFKIARKHFTTTKEIREANSFAPDTVINIGQLLQVPTNTYFPDETIKEHTIAKGDTLYNIAKKYKSSATYIRTLNGLKTGQALTVGESIKIPSEIFTKEQTKEQIVSIKTGITVKSDSAVDYTIASGDTLKTIARKHYTTSSEIRDANGLGATDVLSVGRTIKVPTHTYYPSDMLENHVIKNGDTLQKLVKKYDANIDVIRKVNELKKGEGLKVGSILRIPTTVKESEPAQKVVNSKLTIATVLEETNAKEEEAKKVEEEKLAKQKQEELAKAEALKKVELAKAEALKKEELAKAEALKKVELAKAEALKKAQEEKIAKENELKKQEELAKLSEAQRLAKIKEEAIAKAKAFQEAKLADEKSKADALAKIKAKTEITEPPAENPNGELKIASLMMNESNATEANTTATKVADNGIVKRAEERGVEHTDYTVVAGDTLFTVARKHHTTIREVRQVNGLADGTILEPGRVLRVPMYTYYPKNMIATYAIEAGDTLFSIARKHKTTIDELRQFNDLKKGETLALGRELQVPTNTYSHDGSVEELTDFDDLLRQKNKTRIVQTDTKKKKIATDETQPVNTGNLHKVKKGDSLHDIAKKNNTTVAKIKKLNNIKSNKDLRIGKYISLPKTTRYTRVHRGTDIENNIRKRKRVVIDNTGDVITKDVKKKKGNFFSFMESLGSSSKQKSLPKFAQKHIGKRYVYGASGPNNFDCSGFITYVCKKNGVCLPRTSIGQSRVGKYVARGDLKPGDLLFFDTSRSRRGYVNHVGIYMGGGQFIHASSAQRRVIVTSLNSPFYSSRFKWARRVNM